MKTLKKRLEEKGLLNEVQSRIVEVDKSKITNINTKANLPKSTINNLQKVNTNLSNPEITKQFNEAYKEDTWNRVLNIANQIMNDTKYVGKKTGTGLITGLTGIPQAFITDTANQMQKGQDKKTSKNVKNLITSLTNPNLARAKAMGETIKENIETLKNKDKTFVEKLVEIGTNSVSDATNLAIPVKQQVNALNQVVGGLSPEADEQLLKINEKISEPSKKLNKKLEEERNQHGKVAQTLGDVGQVVGNMVPSIATSVITKNPTMGLATMGISAKGQSTQEALNRGAELDEAIRIGDTKAMTEIGTEMLTGGVNIFGKGAFDDLLEKGIVKKVENEVARFLVQQGVNIAGETVEETISDLLGTLIDKGTVDKNASYSWKDWGETALTTLLSTTILNILTGGMVGDISSAQNRNNLRNNLQQNSTNLTQEQLNSTKKDITQGNIETQEQLNQKLSEYGINQATTMENKPISEQTQQVISNESKIAENQMSQETKGNDKYAIKILNSNYKFVKSGDEKIDNFRQDVSQNWNNSKDTQKLVSTIETIMKDKGVAVRLDANLTDADGNIANGKYENGTITINPNSKRAFEYITTHELTHAIGTKQMLDMVQRYRQDNKEFNSKVETLLKNYDTTELTEEALADVSAQLFGTQEFIANVKNTNPNLFQKIYNEIKYLWHQFRGYKNENQFIEDLYNKWTQAYRNNNKLNDTTNYYIEPVAKFNEIEYNNVIEEKLSKNEYAILRSIINSDSNIKPGINYVEVTNGRYTVYYKGFDDFKVMSRKVDADAGRINKRNDTTGRKTRYSKTFEQSIRNEGTTASNDEVSNFNTPGTRERSGSNTSSSTNIKNDINLPTQESENNSGSFNLQKDKDLENLETRIKDLEQQRDKLLEKEDMTDSDWNKFSNLKKQLFKLKNRKEVIIKSTEMPPTKDNKGRTLSNEQQEWNRYNKARGKVGEIDTKGDLKVFYHYTDSDFDVVDFKKGNQQVFWVTDNPNALEEGIIQAPGIRNNKNINKKEVYVKMENPAGWKEYENYSIDQIQSMGFDGILLEDDGVVNAIVFDNPNQVKYTDNLKPTESSNMKYLKQENAEWQEYLEEHFNTEGTRTYAKQTKLPTPRKIKLPQESVLKQNVSNSKKYTTKKETDTEIAKILDTPVVRQKPKDRKWAILKANILDKGIVFEDLSKKAKNRELEAKWDYTLTSGARAQNAIGNKRYDLSGNVISKGLTEIMDEVGDKINDFQNYMYHQLNVDRMTLKDRLGIDNKPVFGDKIGADYSTRKIAEYEKSNPKFKEWAKDVYDYLKADKAELVKNGVISEELSRKFEELYPHYVPIQRADKLGNAINVPLDTRRTGINTPIKKAKGGSSDINPLFQTMANRTMQTYRASARNSLGVELKNTLQKLNEFKSNESNIEDLDNIIETVSNEAQTNELLKASKDGRLPTFTVFENGNKVTFDISEDMYDALKPMDSSSLFSKTFKPFNTAGNLRRAVLTEYNPIFSLTNTIKDTQDVLLNSQHATKTYLKYPEAYYQIIKKGYWYNEYIQNGGGQNTYFKDGDFEVKKKNKLPTAKDILTLPLKAISKVNGVVEMAPRLAEYIASRESGRSIQTSMLDASRVTTNFKAGGDITKFANRNGATFLNAGVQGTMQAVRNIREANQQGLKGWTVLACKMAIAGAPVFILNHLMWEDDEDYEQLQDYVKDSYYIVGKRDDGTFIRIPKGRTLASIQKVVSNVDKYLNNNEELNIDTLSQDFWETLKFGVENVAPNNPIENNVLSPLFQVATNTSWYGEDIVPERLQNVPKAEQYDETTDKFSKWLGKKLNASPMKINYLLDQYGGGVSDVLLPLGTPQAENTPLEDKFVTDPIMKSKYPGEFFEKADKLDMASNSIYATDTDIVKGKYMSYIQGNISKLYKEKREIQNSTDSDKIKKEKLKEVQKQINETAKMAIEDVESARVTSKSALIGNEEFYKDSDGEWKRIKDEDKIENVSVKTYSDYKVKKEKATDKKRIDKNNENATLNDAEMIELIKNSNYTDKEKDALFDDQINDKTYKNLKLLNNNNISRINQYMDYKTADLDSDKKDDGTKNGKSIYGSKEKKITTYLNNSSFNTIERLYLYGQTYKLSNEQRKTLQKHIKQLNLTSEEQKQIYLDLASSNVEELKDGRIRWK